MATTSFKLATTLPLSPIVPAAAGPAPQAGVVQINLGAETGQVVTGGEFGLATTMGTPNWSYQSYADPSFQTLANQYPTDLLRHNWELNTQMNILFPSRSSVSDPDYSHIDNYLNQQDNLKGFFDNNSGTQIVTLGFPSWLDIGDPNDQALYARMVKGIAQHFIGKGEPIPNYELVNEPDGHENITDLAHTFNAVADALHSLDPSYKLGGLTGSYVHPDDLKAFFGICGKNIGFVSWHQYVTGDSSSKSSQQEVTDSLNGAQSAGQTVRALMQASGIPDSVPLFLGEYNVDGGDYNDANNANMVGAVAAAATTYGMIHSNANFTMGALWDVQNDSAYSVFGHQGDYRIDPVGVVLADLTATMPGNMVQSAMPGNTPGLVGYATKSGAGFSTALINTNLSQGYTVDLGKDGLPTSGLFRVEVSAANPKGSKTALADLSHVSVAAGSVVIVTNEAPHGGLELNGTTSTAPPSAPAGAAAGGSFPAAPAAGASGSGNGSDMGSTKPGLPSAASSGTAATDPGSTGPSGGATQAMAGATTTAPPSTSTGAAGAAGTLGASTPASPGGNAPPAPVGTGADTLMLNLSEDAYRGDAQFELTVDGKAVGPVQSVTAPHGKSQSEAFAFKGDWGSGSHTVGVRFANPAAGSTVDLARSLYLDSASYDGTPVQGSTQVTGSGPVTFALTPTDTLTVTDNDGSSAVVPLVASGPQTDHPSGASTVQQAASSGTDTITSSGSVKGEALTLGAGTRKLVLVNPRAMVLTGGSGADTVTADNGANRFVAGSGSLDVTGGPGAAAYVLHAGGGSLTVEDFDPGKGDTLTVDQALQGALVQASDGHGGTLLAFGAKQGSIDLINHATVSPSAIHFI